MNVADGTANMEQGRPRFSFIRRRTMDPQSATAVLRRLVNSTLVLCKRDLALLTFKYSSSKQTAACLPSLHCNRHLESALVKQTSNGSHG
jgi:hypothetical protein